MLDHSCKSHVWNESSGKDYLVPEWIICKRGDFSASVVSHSNDVSGMTKFIEIVCAGAAAKVNLPQSEKLLAACRQVSAAISLFASVCSAPNELIRGWSSRHSLYCLSTTSKRIVDELCVIACAGICDLTRRSGKRGHVAVPPSPKNWA